MSCLGHLEKQITDNKYISKRVRLFVHQTICASKIKCLEEKDV